MDVMGKATGTLKTISENNNKKSMATAPPSSSHGPDLDICFAMLFQSSSHYSCSTAFKISWRMTEPHVPFLPPAFHAEYGHTILCGTTAAAHLELASPKCTNTGHQ
ncbi:uncharacterized protein J5F26_004845 [Ciconia maguari]